MVRKILKIVLTHKIASGLIVILLIGGGYLGYKKSIGGVKEVRYVLAAAEKGTLITSVSGTGQVSASNQVDVKSRVAGDAIYIGATNGQNIRTGSLLVQLNAQDAQKSVRDAQANLEAAKLSLEKLKQPADQLSLLQAENALAQANETKQRTEDDLVKTYDDGFNTVANAFLDLPNIMTGLQDILFDSTINNNQENIDYYANAVRTYDEKVDQYKDDTDNAYQTARTAYDKNFEDYKSASRFSQTGVIESLVDETYETTKDIAEAVKSANNLIQFYKDKLAEHNLNPNVIADTHLANLNVYTGKTNTHISSLLSIKNTIQTDKETIIGSGRTIAEKTESLAKLKAGTDPLDIQSQELTIKQRENALLDAKEKLADYFIRAPFDGTVAQLNIKKGETVSTGTAVATFITKQRIAEISLNEVDVAKIKIGQKATLTFDAIDGLNITGEVVDIDAIGTVAQGVVTYNVKIGFDTQDERVKPGMSVSAVIIIDVKQNVLVVPNGAVKTQGNTQYVEILDHTLSQGQGNQAVVSSVPPRQQAVEIGLSNDASTEIISGLKEGDQVITQTITANTAQSQNQQNTNIRIPGITGGGFGR
jgi:HlyD family secretion protein